MANKCALPFNKNNFERRTSAAVATLDFSATGNNPQGFTFESGDVLAVAKLPMRSILCMAYATVEEAFDSATSAVLDLGNASDDDKYLAALDLTVAGTTAVSTNLGALLAAGETIVATPTIVGATTKGRVTFTFVYVDLENTTGRYTA